jgi:hypothetical protein
MALRFMVLGAPRSGTAWMANFLSTDRYHCYHDPLFERHYADLDNLYLPGKHVGVACTGLALFHKWVNQHPCPKVILHRTPDLVNASLKAIGLPPAPLRLFEALWKIKGKHVEWTDLFGHEMANIHLHLKLGPFDLERWEMLRNMKITEIHTRRRQDPQVLSRLMKDAFEHGL